MAQHLYEHAERLLARKEFLAARTALESVVAQQPGHAMARLRLSTLATSQGRYRDAVAQLLALVAQSPAEPELLVVLAGMLHRLGEGAAALQCLGSAALLAAPDRELLEEAAQLAVQMDAMELAGALLDAAARRGAPSVAASYTRSTLHVFRGELAAAEQSLESCIQRDPGNVQAHWTLSRVRRQTSAANHVARLQSQLAGRRADAGVPYLAFALFKELDDLGRTEEAWQALMTGCSEKRARLDYRESEEVEAFAALGELSLPDAALPRTDASQPSPIFIVGMPRTGTTLLERILSGHPDVQDAGELDDFPLQLRWMADRFSKSLLDPAVFRSMQGVDVAQLGLRYLEHAAWRARGKPRFTDKLPLNYLHVGLIAAALPGARILHMVRNPMDTCFSNLKELFAEAYPYSYDLRELAGHYGRYRRLMAHWHESMPGRVLDVRYEDLVGDPESSARRVLEFCGLDWQPSSVRVEDRRGAVSTASSAQVREPIHQRSVDGWMRYATQLEPLRVMLARDGWIER